MGDNSEASVLLLSSSCDGTERREGMLRFPRRREKEKVTLVPPAFHYRRLHHPEPGAGLVSSDRFSECTLTPNTPSKQQVPYYLIINKDCNSS